MKVAVIGCGTIANAAHIPSYMKNPEAEIKYFCDIIPERAEAAVQKYNCIKTGKKLPSHIDTVIVTAEMMQSIYDSAEQHREISLS